MNDDMQAALKPYQTDHLILLVGSNPLPNYVAARLLTRPDTRVHFLCTPKTAEIARRVGEQLAPQGISFQIRDGLGDVSPAAVRAALKLLLEQIPKDDSVGLNYTGGTKTMSACAYHVVRTERPRACLSYLDARRMAMVVDGAHPDGTDEVISVGAALDMKIEDMAALHNLKFRDVARETSHLDIRRALQTDHEAGAGWLKWSTESFRCAENRRKFLNSTALKSIKIPEGRFPALEAAMRALGAPSNDFPDWARACGYKDNSDGSTSFAKWISGGYWLEALTFEALQATRTDCRFFDVAMNLREPLPGRDEDRFEFDVAALCGYRLYAFSCVVDDDKGMVKYKLFEAYARAHQIGGDEARVAVVSYADDPDAIRDKAMSTNFFDAGSVRVFGKKDIQNGLSTAFKNWINQP